MSYYTKGSRTRGYTGGSGGYSGSFSGTFSGAGGYSSSPRKGGGFSSGYSSSASSSAGHGGQGSLLQNVIRKLEDSMDDDERRQHYKEVQDDLEVEEDRMETLVKDNQTKLQNTLSTFGKIDATIRESQIKVRMLKDNLQVCKTQLRCKRDELKRLWLDEVKYKQMLKIVDQVETIRGVPVQLAQLRANKQYLEATEKLQNTVAMLDGSLSGIEALRELKIELKQQKESFHLELIKELQRHLYTQTDQHIERQQPHQPHLLRTPQQTVYRAYSPSTPSSPPNTKRQTIRHTRSSSKSGTTESPLVTTPSQITEEAEGSEPKDSVASLVDALAMLHKIPEMLEAVQQHMNQELVLIVERAALHIIKKGSEEGTPPHLQPSAHCDHSKYLLEMLKMCFKQFKAIVNSHSHLLDLLESSKRGYGESYELYTERDVWACIQQVLRGILEVYLAVDEDKPQTAMSAYSPFTIGGHEFSFLRRKTHARRKQTLFRFDNSRHALSISSYMKEQRDRELSVNTGGGGMFDDNQPSISQHLVCRPCTRNITVLYGPMKAFVLKIEDVQQIQDGAHCDLYCFLQDFVEQRFLDCIQAEYTEKLDNSIKFEARQALTLEAKVLKPTLKQALHSSALVLWQSVQELHQLMEDLPMYSSHFLSIMLHLLQSYQDSSYTFYCDLTNVSHDKGHSDKHSTHRGSVVSAVWARDGDINRLLRSMASWHRHASPSQALRAAHDAPGIGKDSVYAKESHNLLVGLGKEVSARQHVLHDHDNIKQLAVLHESMEWFAHNLKQLAGRLTKWHKEFGVGETTDGAAMSRGHRHHAAEHEDDQEQESEENQVQTRSLLDQLSKVVSDLTSLSETTLIMLHLELRAHCCYYLLPTLKQSSYVCEDEVSEVDQGVKEMAVDLTNMRTIMAGVLTQDKQRYLFDGIGHLIAAIFITSTHHIKKININGVKKMCRNIQHMQSCLSKITSIRERDLDLAQKYFTMLYVNEEEFLKLVMEEGKQFTRDDYANALELLARSQSNYNEIRLQNNLDRLEKMFASDAC